MLKRFEILFKVGLAYAGCAAVIGFAQAAPTQLTAISTVKGDTSWQDIAGTSYKFADTNHNGQINVGETVTFTIDMHKTNWGIHDFDALKFWIDDSSGTHLSTKQFIWDFDKYVDNSNPNIYSYKDWELGDKFFSFKYTFATAGIFDLTASVMCSADLSGLSGWADGNPTSADWNAWSENTHQQYKDKGKWIQGETEKYKFTVVQQPVPEPETYAMLLVGLGLLGFTARRRKDFNA